MSRIVLGNQRHQVGLTSDYPSMSAIEALVQAHAPGRVLYRAEITSSVSGDQANIHDTGQLFSEGNPTGNGIEVPGPVGLRVRAPMWGWSTSQEEPKSVELECQWTTDDAAWGGFEGVARLEASTDGSLLVPLNFEGRARDGSGDIDPGIYRFKAFLWVRSGSVEPMVFAQGVDRCIFEVVALQPETTMRLAS